MLFHQYLRTRKSVREYKNNSLSKKQIELLQEQIKKDNLKLNEFDLNIEFFEKGESVYKLLEGEGGYFGKMIKSPHYIGISVKGEDDAKKYLNAAYTLAKYGKMAFDMELGTCWINLLGLSKKTEKDLLKDEDLDMHFLLAIGEANEPYIGLPKETSSRLSIEEIVFLNSLDNKMSLSEMKTWGLEELFYNIRNVPTNMNRQPWRFVVDNDKIQMYILGEDSPENLTDAGIMMFNFEKMAHDLGIRGNWSDLNSKQMDSQNQKYFLVGIFDM